MRKLKSRNTLTTGVTMPLGLDKAEMEDGKAVGSCGGLERSGGYGETGGGIWRGG